MTIREELEKLGPEAVRAGMLAFEHREAGKRCGQNICCFLTHACAIDDVQAGRQIIARSDAPVPLVEAAFEYDGLLQSDGWSVAWWDGSTRADLYSECVAFLAEHGSATEPRPVEAEVSR